MRRHDLSSNSRAHKCQLRSVPLDSRYLKQEVEDVIDISFAIKSCCFPESKPIAKCFFLIQCLKRKKKGTKQPAPQELSTQLVLPQDQPQSPGGSLNTRLLRQLPCGLDDPSGHRLLPNQEESSSTVSSFAL